jgi:hypothetical protein
MAFGHAIPATSRSARSFVCGSAFAHLHHLRLPGAYEEQNESKKTGADEELDEEQD